MNDSRSLARPRAPRPHGLALALAASSLLTLPLGQAAAQVLPTGPTVVAGQAQVAVNGGHMTVTNAANTILNWNSFSIGAQNGVHFAQPHASSQVLNRVTGNDPSQILGQLSSNGRVWLLNPNGVLFGQGARVNVGGLVASSLRLNDQDWLGGRHAFSAGAPGASVVNQGELRSTLGGRVVLLGGSVRNEGLIDAPGGQVLLAAGDSLELVDTGAPNLTVRLDASQGEALNLGTLRSASGHIDVHAAVVNQQGLVQADALSAGPGGEIVLQAKERLNLAQASVTSAASASGQGGKVKLLGREVGLFGNARVDASGASGGGDVLVGGGLQGKDASVPNAEAVYFGREAKVQADATDRGDGGRIILWSDKATRAFGSLNARGGAQGGHGGFIETSGGWLDARPLAIDVAAPHGQAGQWLLDPYNITIMDGPISGQPNYDASFTATGNDATIASSTIADALNAGTSVTVSTGTGGDQAGHIYLSGATIAVTANTPGSLSLIADGNVEMYGASITSSGGALAVSVRAGRSAGGGQIGVLNSTIRTAGGDVLLGGYATGFNADNSSFGNAAAGGISLQGGTVVDAGTGRLQILGHNGSTGVSVHDAILRAADIELRGQSTESVGVGIWSGEITATRSLNISGNGQMGGVDISGGLLSVAPTALDASANLTVMGRTAFGQAGVSISAEEAGATQLQVSNRATMEISGGSNPGSEGASVGVRLENYAGEGAPALLQSTANGGPISVSARFGNTNGSDLVASGQVVRADGGKLSMATSGQLVLQNAQLSATDRIDLRAAAIRLEEGTTLASSGLGVGIWLRGIDDQGLPSLQNEAGADVLSTPNGRWIIWGRDALNASSLNLGGLDYDFKRYGVPPSEAWNGDSGNGLVYSTSHTAQVNVTVQDRFYDGTNVAALSQGTAVGINGDLGSLRPHATSTFTDKNVGQGKVVNTPTSDAFEMRDSNGKPVYGYAMQSSNPITASITPAWLTGTVTANHKVYDGTTAATFTIGNLQGLASGETVVVNAQAAFRDKNVGTGKALLDAQFSLADGSNGGLASNYVFMAGTSGFEADITPLSLSLSGLQALGKVYDASTGAALAGIGQLSGVLDSDQVSLAGSGVGSFADKNVGTGKAVTVSGYSLSGADAGNYSLMPIQGLSADITPLSLSLGGLQAVGKVYDASTRAALAGTASLGGVLDSDQVSLAGTGVGSFADKNVGTGKAVSVSGYSLSGADAGNYSLMPIQGLSADITPLSLSLSGLQALGKVYDASTRAALAGTASLGGVLDSDQVGLAGSAVGSFADKNVGTGKAVSVSGYSLSGADAGNYSLAPQQGLSADITPATLYYVADAASALLGAPLTGLTGSVSGFVGGETQADATRGTLVFAGPSDVSTPGPYAIEGSGLSATNYVFAQAQGNAQALTLLPVRADTGGQGADVSLHAALQTLPPPPPPYSSLTSGLADVTGALPAPTAAMPADFGSVRLGSLSPGQLQALLEARDQHKKTLFAESISRLEQDPGLADMQPCASVAEAAAGGCMVTAELKAQVQAAQGQGPEDAAAATAPAPTPAPAAAPAAAPAPPVAPAAAAAGPVPPPPVAIPLQRRRVQTASLPQIERKVALVIGVNRYADPSIPQLANAVGDAQALSRLFESRLGYETVLVENANKATVVAALNRLALELGPRDSVLVYYAGHGELVQATGQGYWQLADSDAKKPESWLSNADIARLLGQIGASQVALISDSCYSGSLAEGERIRATPGRPSPEQLMGGKAMVTMSSGGNEPVFDEGKGGHSPFAWNLMNSLNQVNQWQAGGNLFERVRFAVARELPQRPRYGAAPGHQRGADYLFEQRQLDQRN